MKKKLESIVYGRLARSLPESDDEKYLYLISLAACSYAVAMHLFLMGFNLTVKVLPLFFFCLGGLMVDLYFFRLIQRRHYLLFGLLLSVSVIVHTIVSTIYIGSDNLIIVYLLITIIMQVIIPYARAQIRAVAVFVLWAGMVALILIGHHIEPIYDIGKDGNTILSLFNINLAFFGILIQLTIGNSVRIAIAKINQEALLKSRHEANTDPLTGLFNRRYAEDVFKRLSCGQLDEHWCVAILDIDDFKVFNDTYGHRVGDSALVWLSNTLTESLRRTDFVFRWGGEEFLILLKDVEIATAFYLMEKLRAKLERETLGLIDKTANITVTIGVAPLDVDNIEKSIEASDRLLYQGKNSGKNRVVA